jgi:tetratricopeptide (TPR) repeat protein
MTPTPTPHSLQALYASAQTHLDALDLDKAQADAERLLTAMPNSVEGLVLMSRIAFEQGDRDTCLSSLRRALDLAPDAGALWFVTANRLRHFGLETEALDALDTAARLEKSPLRAHAEKGHYLQTLGRFEEADKLFRKLMKRHPEETELYRLALAGRKVAKGDPLIRQMGQLWAHPRLNDTGRMHLGFALAKAMDDTGSKERVFRFLEAANAAQQRLYPFDSSAQEAEWRSALAAQDGLGRAPKPADPDRPVAVFVTGMPRSGTTLVEQIIASHSRAHAGGETGHAVKQAWQMFGPPPQMRPLAEQPPEALEAWADRYLTLMTRDTGATSGVVTDKSILSHQVFGLIHTALPGARLIVVHRDPRDIALSIYRNFFKPGTHRYANRLADIAGAIKQFRLSVAHWQERLPGVIHEVRYEALVSDPEPQARALIAAAGLDWEDACLKFHETAGVVQTLSLAQVRQPIHAGRRQAWKAFEADLQPFIEAWGDTPWD